MFNRKEYLKQWRKANPHKQKEHTRNMATKRYPRNRKIIDDNKNQPCMDCGGSFPLVCMDYDHRDPKTKKQSIGKCLAWSNEQALLDEIAKCDVVCANCHRIRTHRKETK